MTIGLAIVVSQRDSEPDAVNFFVELLQVLNILMPNFEFHVGMVFSMPLYFHYDPAEIPSGPLYLFELK